MKYKEIRYKILNSYRLKRSGFWGYKWKWYSKIEREILIIINYTQPPRIIWRLLEIIFPQLSLVSSIKCRCKNNKKFLHLLKYHL